MKYAHKIKNIKKANKIKKHQKDNKIKKAHKIKNIKKKLINLKFTRAHVLLNLVTQTRVVYNLCIQRVMAQRRMPMTTSQMVILSLCVICMPSLPTARVYFFRTWLIFIKDRYVT